MLPPLSIDVSLPGLPVIAPLLGAVILVTLGWRWLYGGLVVAGVVLVVAVTAGLPETAPGMKGRRRDAYARVLRLPRTIPLAVFVACSFGAYFTLISGSPFELVAQMHVASGPYAVAFAINACALLAGSFAAGRLVRRAGTERLFAAGVALAGVASALAAAIPLAPSAGIGITVVAAALLAALAYVWSRRGLRAGEPRAAR